MKSALALVAFAAVAQAQTPAENDMARMKLIEEVNNTPGATWKAGMNERFKGQPMGQKSLYGVKEGNLEHLKATTTEVTMADWEKLGHKVEDIPNSFDSEKYWPQCAKIIGDIRDQSMCGCCWAFGGAEAASDRLCIATNATMAVPLSSQETCFCASSDGCDGGFISAPWQYMQSNGLVTGGQHKDKGALGGGWCSKFSMPHCHHHGPQGKDPYPAEGTPGCPEQTSAQCPTKCDADATAPHNDFAKDRYTFTGTVSSYPGMHAMQTAIVNQGPVEVAFTVYSDFENYVSGVYSHTGGSYLGGHAVRIVGWGTDSGTDYWKVANSWNPFWGENGYFRIKRGDNECDIESQVAASSPDAKWHKMM